ncbi:hypothetical protein BpHYR1_029807, partial [Brachionus plicatilis]
RDGRAILCHSISKELWAVYDADGQKLLNDNLSPLKYNQKLEDQIKPKYLTYADQLGTGHKRDPTCCAEFRSIYIIAERLEISPRDVVSINAFQENNSNFESKFRCANCQVTTNFVNDSFVFTDWTNENQDNTVNIYS